MVANNALPHRLTTRVGRWGEQGRAISGVSNGVKVSAWFKFGKNGADAKSAGASTAHRTSTEGRSAHGSCRLMQLFVVDARETAV